MRDPLSPKPLQSPLERRIRCDRTPLRYDLCSVDGPTVLDPTRSIFFALGPTNSTQIPFVEKIRPYPRKYENFIMSRIKNITLVSGATRSPPCQIQHEAPALVFAAGGYTGNFYHDFNDGFIPLFITVNTILPDQDFVIVVSEAPHWWSSKYAKLLHAFSKHPIISLESDTSTHCFPSAKVGLISHGFMTINQTLMPNSKTYIHFRGLLDKAFGQNHAHISKPSKSRPRLILMSRSGTTGRRIVNQKEVIKAIQDAGFRVTVLKPMAKTSLLESYALINSSHAMIGVHGAALTHSLFLRPGSVFMQVIPIGVDWAADAFFGRVARGLDLEYVEYKIGVEESSLVDKYGKDSMLLNDPVAFRKNGWPTGIMDIYLKEQNVILDMVRFRGYLKKAYKKAKKFMQKEG
ncbi:EGF domain-specific O-linked N-acetylglucosamine transferase [Morella rubra]|uniref:EGF domain-specific O-linked N-acetylglucosamine transferase n=1 Tax=Morella rubra TaxID=262757 RepID=A0A6A1V856_9ROSI|nr:EGF domain-specific O-linked N-acetylglucosamine transferase [Morella rubra]